MHYFSPFHKTIETAIYRKGGEGQEYRFNWYPPFLITLKMKTCNDRIAIYLLNCELNFCICSGFSELCTYFLLLNLISPFCVHFIYLRPDSERKDAEYKKRSFLYSASKNQFFCKQKQRSSRVARFFYCKPNFRK